MSWRNWETCLRFGTWAAPWKANREEHNLHKDRGREESVQGPLRPVWLGREAGRAGPSYRPPWESAEGLSAQDVVALRRGQEEASGRTHILVFLFPLDEGDLPRLESSHG